MRKFIRTLIGLMACGVLAFSLYQIFMFVTETSASSKLNESMVNEFVTLKKPGQKESSSKPAKPGATDPAAESQPEGETAPADEPPISVDFEMLKAQSENVIGWLYCEDTQINLPLAQAKDNDYYLRRLLDGTGNNSGTLFADFRNARDFSDRNTIIYGHNMKIGTMFGTLEKYRKQEYYDEHPIMWLLTEDGNYKVELVAGYVTHCISDAYSFPESDEETLDLAVMALQKSTFSSDVVLNPDDRFITLSTCTYDFEDARYVVLGRLVPVE